jgi:epoxyqueuosine reductase QueG
MAALADRIKQWGAELGFQAVGIADIDLSAAGGRLAEWLGWVGTAKWIIWRATRSCGRALKHCCPARCA